MELTEVVVNLYKRIEQLEKEVAELKGQVPARSEEPKVVFEKILPNGTKVVGCNSSKAVGMYIDGQLRADNSDGQQKS